MDEIDLDEPAGEPQHDRKTLVIALGAVGLLALTIAIVRATRKAANAPIDGTAQAAMDAGDWRATVQHLAAAMEQRFHGVEEQLDEIRAQMGQPAPSAPPAPAAVSDVVGAPPIIERVPPDPASVGATEPPPPAPAAVSL